MKKISTLFKKDPTNLGRVINEPHPDNLWVFETDNWVATRKFDGTSCAIIDGKLYKRYDAKIGKNGKNKPIPERAIECQPSDEHTGHHPHWVSCDREKPEDKWHFKAFDALNDKVDGTYELCGEKVQKNPEGITGHVLIPHGKEVINLSSIKFDDIKRLLQEMDIEGIVFHETNGGRMCKIRKSDFGIKR